MTRVATIVLSFVLLVGCAPAIQHAARPLAGFSGPRLERDAFTSFDGTRLGLSQWSPAGGEPTAVVIGMHGMNDWAQSFWIAAPWWAQHGIATIAYDQRGFGRSPNAGVWADPDVMTRDLATLCALVRARFSHSTIAVVGESMGGAVAIEAFASARPPDADRLVLLAPAIWGWSEQPLFNRIAVWLGGHVFADKPFDPPAVVTGHIWASDNRVELFRMGRDPRLVAATRPDAVYGLMGLMDRASRDIARVRVPVFYAYGAHDQLIPRGPSFRAAGRLKPTDRTAYYPHGWHILLRDYAAATVWGDTESFIHEPGAPLPSGAAPIPHPSR